MHVLDYLNTTSLYAEICVRVFHSISSIHFCLKNSPLPVPRFRAIHPCSLSIRQIATWTFICLYHSCRKQCLHARSSKARASTVRLKHGSEVRKDDVEIVEKCDRGLYSSLFNDVLPAFRAFRRNDRFGPRCQTEVIFPLFLLHVWL